MVISPNQIPTDLGLPSQSINHPAAQQSPEAMMKPMAIMAMLQQRMAQNQSQAGAQ
jgi:hypothetical protein